MGQVNMVKALIIVSSNNINNCRDVPHLQVSTCLEVQTQKDRLVEICQQQMLTQ